MEARIRVVEYFYTMVRDQPGEACKLLSQLASEEVNLLAFNAVPIGHDHTQLVIYPEDAERLIRTAERGGYTLTGPQRAILIQGDDRLGALITYLRKLCDARINMSASSGVTDGRGGYGYIIHLRAEDIVRAAEILGIS
jgi:prephenate dehydratase